MERTLQEPSQVRVKSRRERDGSSSSILCCVLCGLCGGKTDVVQTTTEKTKLKLLLLTIHPAPSSMKELPPPLPSPTGTKMDYYEEGEQWYEDDESVGTHSTATMHPLIDLIREGNTLDG